MWKLLIHADRQRHVFVLLKQTGELVQQVVTDDGRLLNFKSFQSTFSETLRLLTCFRCFRCSHLWKNKNKERNFHRQILHIVLFYLFSVSPPRCRSSTPSSPLLTDHLSSNWSRPVVTDTISNDSFPQQLKSPDITSCLTTSHWGFLSLFLVRRDKRGSTADLHITTC